MTHQRELDLPLPAARNSARRVLFAGLTLAQLGLGVLAIAAIIWAMWATRLLLAPEAQRLASARLSEIVGEYVQAEARSAAPPAQVEAEMRRFMASLDRELGRRSGNGQVVLVGEAVLTRNIPDITDDLRRAVYASGVRRPSTSFPAIQAAPLGQSMMPEPGTSSVTMKSPRSAAGAPTPRSGEAPDVGLQR